MPSLHRRTIATAGCASGRSAASSRYGWRCAGERLRWTAGEPAAYRSSHYLDRVFCRACGTPLGARYVPELQDWQWSDFVGVLLGTLDTPEAVRPGYHFGIESRLPWFDVDDGLPRRRTDDLPGMKELWARAPAE